MDVKQAFIGIARQLMRHRNAPESMREQDKGSDMVGVLSVASIWRFPSCPCCSDAKGPQ